MAEYRLHFCGVKVPLFLYEILKIKENAICTEQAKLVEYPA